MSPTEVMIHDVAEALADLQMQNDEQRRAIFEKTIGALVKYAITQREVEQINGIRADMRKFEQIRAEARRM